MDSVIIFRATPKQKAEVVQLIKNNLPSITTLAIGDGANDVNMITSAHVGVGIIGEEGKQAARASDYSIAQFSFLKRLLLVHGREAYRKNTFIVCYNFYKNCLFVIPQFWFGIYSLFSGQTLYDPWIYQLYNIVFTSLPIIWFGIYDLEINHDLLENSEKHYAQGIIGKLFHSNRFWKWVISAIVKGFILFFFFFFAFSGFNENGNVQDLWAIGSMIYYGVVLVANIRLLFTTNNHTFISIFLFFNSIFGYVFVLFVMSCYTKFENFNNFFMIMTSLKFYMVMFSCVLLIFILDLGIGKMLILYGCVKDPLKININQIYEFNRSNNNENLDRKMDSIQNKDGYVKVNDQEN